MYQGQGPKKFSKAPGSGLLSQEPVVPTGQDVGEPGDRREHDRRKEDANRRPRPRPDPAAHDEKDGGQQDASVADINRK